MNKPRKKCIFCSNPVDSKEHLWSVWMHRHLGQPIATRHNRHTITKWPDGREDTNGPTNRTGGAFTIQVRAVCSSCNSGWMNRAEGRVRPFLRDMIEGNPVTLSATQIEDLAYWCAIKFIVLEHASDDTSITPRRDRVAFRESGKIPSYFRIYVGNHASKYRSGLRRSSRCMALSHEGPKPPLVGTAKNIQTTTILMGKLFIHLNAARVDNFEIERAYIVARVWDECRVWPIVPATRKWPHRPLLDDAGLSMIAHTLETLFSASNTIWLDETPI